MLSPCVSVPLIPPPPISCELMLENTWNAFARSPKFFVLLEVPGPYFAFFCKVLVLLEVPGCCTEPHGARGMDQRHGSWMLLETGMMKCGLVRFVVLSGGHGFHGKPSIRRFSPPPPPASPSHTLSASLPLLSLLVGAI